MNDIILQLLPIGDVLDVVDSSSNLPLERKNRVTHTYNSSISSRDRLRQTYSCTFSKVCITCISTVKSQMHDLSVMLN